MNQRIFLIMPSKISKAFYTIKVIPRASRNFVKQEGDVWKVYLTAPAIEGKANKALVDLLAGHFSVRTHHIKITKGLKSSHKTIRIETFARN